MRRGVLAHGFARVCCTTCHDEIVDRHDQRITRCLELYRAGRLPI